MISLFSIFSTFLRTKCVLLLVFLLPLSHQRSTPQDDSYVAATLEYNFSTNMDENLQNYLKYIEEAATQNADIIVFPELTLTNQSSSIPVPINGILKQFPIPALRDDLYHEVLVNISKAARQHQIYVLINVQEIVDCTSPVTGEECPEAKIYYFNTNVVLDRTGAVIDRYRKINLFGEWTRTPALKPDLGVFTTDFGVKFGHYVCFDLMFQVPAIQVVEQQNITDILFSTMWFSELPYLTAVQIQEAYAYAMDVNFIGAGANNVRVGSAGSGIYSGKAGALISIMPGLPTTRLLVSRVPKVPGKVDFPVPGPIYDKPEDHDNLLLLIDPSITKHVSRPLTEGFQEFTLIDREVTCKFRVRIAQGTAPTTHKYRAFVFDGSNTYAKRKLGISLCLVVACLNESVASCARGLDVNKNDVEIHELDIEMSTYKLQYNDTLECDNVVYMPASLQTNKFPLNPQNYTFNVSPLKGRHYEIDMESNALHDTRKEAVTFKLNKPQKELFSFGIWGRIFTKDVDNSKTNEVSQEDILNFVGVENTIYEALQLQEIKKTD